MGITSHGKPRIIGLRALMGKASVVAEGEYFRAAAGTAFFEIR